MAPELRQVGAVRADVSCRGGGAEFVIRWLLARVMASPPQANAAEGGFEGGLGEGSLVSAGGWSSSPSAR